MPALDYSGTGYPACYTQAEVSSEWTFNALWHDPSLDVIPPGTLSRNAVRCSIAAISTVIPLIGNNTSDEVSEVGLQLEEYYARFIPDQQHASDV